MTDGSRKVFEFLKANYGTKLTTADIASALGVSGPVVTGSVNGLSKKGLAVREPVATVGSNGKEVVTKYISLTEAGMQFDPDAEVEKAEKSKKTKKAE